MSKNKSDDEHIIAELVLVDKKQSFDYNRDLVDKNSYEILMIVNGSIYTARRKSDNEVFTVNSPVYCAYSNNLLGNIDRIWQTENHLKCKVGTLILLITGGVKNSIVTTPF